MKRGFTFIEIIIGVFLFMIISAVSLNLLSFATIRSNAAAKKYESIENCQVVLDFLTSYINSNEDFLLYTNNSTFYELDIFYNGYLDKNNYNIISYDSTSKKVSFGGKSSGKLQKVNTLATNIDSFNLNINNNYMYVNIISKNINGIESTINTVIDLKYKSFY